MKKYMLATAIILMMVTSGILAQSDADMKAWQSYMTPGDVHKMIAKYDGDWNEEVSMWIAPGAPASEYKATAKNEMVMGGRYQQSKTTGEMMGMPFEGMSILGYDNAKKTFTSTWIDNFGTGTMHMEGIWDEKTRTVIFNGKTIVPMTGKEQQVRQTMQLIDNDHQLMEMFMVSNGAEFKTMSIKFSRKK